MKEVFERVYKDNKGPIDYVASLAIWGFLFGIWVIVPTILVKVLPHPHFWSIVGVIFGSIAWGLIMWVSILYMKASMEMTDEAKEALKREAGL